MKWGNKRICRNKDCRRVFQSFETNRAGDTSHLCRPCFEYARKNAWRPKDEK